MNVAGPARLKIFLAEMTRLVEVQRAYQNMSALLAKTDELRGKAISRLADQQA